MFDLEKSIANWRKQMLAAGIKTPAPLDELELHLREEIRVRLAAGVAERQAFADAVTQIGRADSLREEFNKMPGSGTLWINGGWLLWAGLATIAAIFLAREQSEKHMGVLLTAHIFTLTFGYLTAFFAGTFSALHIWMQWSGGKSPGIRQRFISASNRFADFATVLVAFSFGLGMIWTNEHLGHYWIRDIREITAFGALALLVALFITRRIWQPKEPKQALLGLGASLTVGTAWFSLPLFAHGTLLNNGWPLALFIGLHLLVFGAALRCCFTTASD
jgi:hypothetical protein